MCTNLLHNLQDVIEWYEQQLKKNDATEEIVPLNNLEKWKFDNEIIWFMILDSFLR